MIKIEIKDVQLVPVGEIKRNPENLNKHSKEQIEELARHYAVYGMRTPLIASNQSGLLAAGDGRFQAALIAKMTHVPVSFQDFESPEQEFGWGVADNGLSLWSELDMIGINAKLESMPKFNPHDLGILNFKPIDTEVLEPGCDEDAVPEFVQPKTKPGDLYKLGNHRLLCGDSTNIQHVEKLMDGEKADMVFTDPPYGVSYQSNMRTASQKFDVIENDQQFLSEWVNVLPIVSAGWVFVWTTWKVLAKWLEITAPIGPLTNMIIWDKGGGGIGDLEKTFSTDYEIALVFNRGAKIVGKRLGSVWEIGKDSSSAYLHPTQKPVALSEMAIQNCVNQGETILDLFGGSGSTLIACEKTKRKAFLLELDPQYCDVIVARWEKYTGKKAELING